MSWFEAKENKQWSRLRSKDSSLDWEKKKKKLGNSSLSGQEPSFTVRQCWISALSLGRQNLLSLSLLIYKIGLTLTGRLGRLTEKLHQVVGTAPGSLETHLISNKPQDNNSRSCNNSNNSSEWKKMYFWGKEENDLDSVLQKHRVWSIFPRVYQDKQLLCGQFWNEMNSIQHSEERNVWIPVATLLHYWLPVLVSSTTCLLRAIEDTL